MIQEPICVYINWASYDELSDNVELTEKLALQQLDELLRLRKLGVQLDYYMMDAFWFSKDGGYRAWRQPHWPDGPDRWLQRCLEHDVKPGLWISGNSTCKLDPFPAWEDSLTERRTSMCMFYGGFMPHLLETFHQYYERGVRMYKLDFMDLNAAPPVLERTMLPAEIRAMNVGALRAALKGFRASHPDVKFIGYNGLEDVHVQSNTSLPFRKSVDPVWLESFDALYCGDPRPADVPCMRFWRSKDIYSDHMVRFYEACGFPLQGIDNSGFMIGTTGTCYFRKTAAWQGMLILGLARGGFVNTYYGNLELLDEPKARWFAKVQSLFLELQRHGRFQTFGGVPGKAVPYGFIAEDRGGALVSVVNPAQSRNRVALPLARLAPTARGTAKVLFRDAGGALELDASHVTLGPEQMVLIGFGRYAASEFDLGAQEDVVIPDNIAPIEATFEPEGDHAIRATFPAPVKGAIRLIMRQRTKEGGAKRHSGGSPPNGTPMGQLLSLHASQNGHELPVTIEYDKAIWSGLSWAVGEIEAGFKPNVPVTVIMRSKDPTVVVLSGEAYQVGQEKRVS